LAEGCPSRHIDGTCSNLAYQQISPLLIRFPPNDENSNIKGRHKPMCNLGELFRWPHASLVARPGTYRNKHGIFITAQVVARFQGKIAIIARQPQFKRIISRSTAKKSQKIKIPLDFMFWLPVINDVRVKAVESPVEESFPFIDAFRVRYPPTCA
jgi:hypothetical protein